MSRYFEAMRVALERARRDGREVHRRRGHGGLRPAGPPRGRRAPGRPRGRRHAGRAAGPERRRSGRLGHRAAATTSASTRGEVIAGDASLGQRLVTGDAVNTAARLEQAAGSGRDRPRRPDLPPRARPDRGRADRRRSPSRARRSRSPPTGSIAVRGPQAERAARRRRRSSGARRRWSRLEMTAARGGGHAVVRAADRHRRRGRRQVPADPRVRRPGLGAATQPGAARALPAVWRRRHVLADRRDRPRARRGSTTRTRSRLRSARSPTIARGAPDGPTIRRRSSIGSRRRSACPRPSSRRRSCSGGSASCSRRSRAGGRWSRSSTTSTCAAPTFLELLDHLLETVQGAPILLLASARHELLETRHATGPPPTRRADRPRAAARPTDADAIVDELLGGPRRVASASGSLRPPRATRCTSSRSRRCSSRRGAIRPRWRSVGRDRADRASSRSRRPSRRSSARASTRCGTRSARSIDPASVIGLGVRRRRGRPPRPGRCGPGRSRHVSTSLTAKQFVRPTVADEDVLPVRPPVIKDAAYRQPAQAHPRGAPRAVRRLGGARSTASAAESSSSRRSSATTSSRPTATGPSWAPSMTGREVGRRGAAKLSSAGRRALARGDLPAAASLLPRSVDLLPPEDPHRIEVLPDLAESLFLGLGEAELAKPTPGSDGRRRWHRRCSPGRAGRDRADPDRTVLGWNI